MAQKIKLIFLSVFFTTITVALSAQNLYFGVQTGYGFATNAGQANLFNIEDRSGNSTYEATKGGYGDGVNVAAKVGFHLNKNISFELGANYLSGRTLTHEYGYSYSNGGTQVTESNIYSYNSRMLQLSPQLVFNAQNESKLTPYAKVGIAFGLLTNIKNKTEVTNTGGFAGTIKTEYEQTTEGNIPIGLNAALGANYALNEKMSLYTELCLLNMSYAPKMTTMTSYVVNDDDVFDNLSTSQKETIYLDMVEIDYNTQQDLEKPQEGLKVFIPFSNVSFNIGLRIDLGTATE